MTTACFGPAALLSDGRVLFPCSYGGDKAAAELFNPATGTFAEISGVPTGGRIATSLSNGGVLITGTGRGAAAELYDEATGKFAPTGSMSTRIVSA